MNERWVKIEPVELTSAIRVEDLGTLQAEIGLSNFDMPQKVVLDVSAEGHDTARIKYLFNKEPRRTVLCNDGTIFIVLGENSGCIYEIGSQDESTIFPPEKLCESDKNDEPANRAIEIYPVVREAIEFARRQESNSP